MVTVVSPGEWNRGAGPDFINATIKLDGRTFHGSIEIDLDSRNWERHGHHQSEPFNEEENRVMSALRESDGLVEVTGLATHQISVILMKLEVRKLVQTLHGQRFSRAQPNKPQS